MVSASLSFIQRQIWNEDKETRLRQWKDKEIGVQEEDLQFSIASIVSVFMLSCECSDYIP